jgi:hypothetical protein
MRRLHKLEDSEEDIDRWLLPFQHLTFPTLLFPLSQLTARAYLSKYRHRYCQSSPPSSSELLLLDELTQQIDNAIHQFNGPCFIRLTSRSPKDAAQINFQQFLQSHSASSPNDKLISYFQLVTSKLQVHSGVEAMDLLSKSERIFLDLQQALDADAEIRVEADTEVHCPWQVGICIRQWDPRINDQWEFRCFIHHSALCAISQYNTFIYCADLHQHKDTIQSLIQAYCTLHVLPILQKMGKRDVVVDLALFPPTPSLEETAAAMATAAIDSDQSLSFFSHHLAVIELNPYNARTGGSCFHWDRDRDILLPPDPQTSPTPPVFRLVGEEEAFDLREFSRCQENALEGLEAQHQHEEERERLDQQRAALASSARPNCQLM